MILKEDGRMVCEYTMQENYGIKMNMLQKCGNQGAHGNYLWQ